MQQYYYVTSPDGATGSLCLTTKGLTFLPAGQDEEEGGRECKWNDIVEYSISGSSAREHKLRVVLRKVSKKNGTEKIKEIFFMLRTRHSLVEIEKDITRCVRQCVSEQQGLDDSLPLSESLRSEDGGKFALDEKQEMYAKAVAKKAREARFQDVLMNGTEGSLAVDTKAGLIFYKKGSKSGKQKFIGWANIQNQQSNSKWPTLRLTLQDEIVDITFAGKDDMEQCKKEIASRLLPRIPENPPAVIAEQPDKPQTESFSDITKESSKDGRDVLDLRQHPELWSISYEQLLELAEKAVKVFGKRAYKKITMRDINRKILEPHCRETGTSYALDLNPKGLKIEAFITHAWDEPFEQFVEVCTCVFCI